MRKIFLTSGLVLCLFYPAFADIPAGSSTANCTESVLDSTTGPVEFNSDWRPMISGAITLDSERYTSNNGSAVTPYATNNASPDTLYAVYGVGVYTSQPTVSTLSNFTTSNRTTSLISTPTRTGYNFAGFYTTKATDGTQVIDSSGNLIYTNDAASTQFSADNATSVWYARWTPINYSISFGCGSAPAGTSSTISGSGPGNVNAGYETQYSLATSYGTCALPGYHATGWDCTGGAVLNNATGTQSTWSSAANIVCTVHWTANTISLNYYQDDEAVTPFTTGTCTYDDTFTLPTNYQPKNGYHFNGWIVRSNGGS